MKQVRHDLGASEVPVSQAWLAIMCKDPSHWGSDEPWSSQCLGVYKEIAELCL